MIKISTIELDNIWQREKWVDKLRTTLIPLIQKDLERSEIKYDAQDLEHQIVFRMLTDDTLEMADALEEQKAILLERIQKAKVAPGQLFCFGWNRKDKPWQMEWGKNKEELYAVRGSEKKEIIFREITLRQEKEICKDIIKNYHYIHCDRCDA